MAKFNCRNGKRGEGPGRRIFWISDHELLPCQLRALEEIHGPAPVVSLKSHVIGYRDDGLTQFLKKHQGEIVYAVCSKAQQTHAALACAHNRRLSVGFFSNLRHKRGRQYFNYVHMVVDGQLKKVYDDGRCVVSLVA